MPGEDVRDQGRQVVAGGDLGQALEGGGGQHELRLCSHQLVEHATGVGRASVRDGQLLAEGLEVLGRVDVERQRIELHDLGGDAGAARVGHVPAPAVRARSSARARRAA